MPLLHGPMESPIGDLWITVSERGLHAITRGGPPQDSAFEPAAVADLAVQLRDYFDGQLRSFDVSLDLTGVGAFDVVVWEAARRIPYGETASYGELAAMAGNPRAARAAGGAMSRCRLFPVVPCHRVIRADGSLGGWGGEEWIKRWLLDMERGSRTSAQG